MPRTRKAKATRPTAHEAFIDAGGDDAEEELPLSDEESNPRSKENLKLIAHDGQLGFSHQKQGFDPRTNFTLEIRGDIYSTEYQLKGIVCVSDILRGGTQEISQRSILSGKYIFEVKKYFLKSQKSI